MHEGIRATGVAEFAAPDAPPDMRNRRHGAAPGQGAGARASRASPPRNGWARGRRIPNSKPVIGRSPRHSNVFFAFGHDHLGLTMAGITGKLVAELATGKPTTRRSRAVPARPVLTMVLAVAYKWDFSLVFNYANLWVKGLGVTLAYSVGTVLGGMIIGVICGMLLL